MTAEKIDPALALRACTPDQIADDAAGKGEGHQPPLSHPGIEGAYQTGTGKTALWGIPPAAIDHYQKKQPRY